MSTNIRDIFAAFFPLPEAAMRKLEALFEMRSIPKGEDFLREGQTSKLEYVVLAGICKSYLFNPEGEEITLSFFLPNSIVSPYTTRIREGRSVLNIKALTDLKLLTMDANKFEALMVADLDIRNFGNAVLRKELMDKVEKEIGLASLPGKERLQILRKRYPNLENLISHKDIASYLGITPISLSRLRKNS